MTFRLWRCFFSRIQVGFENWVVKYPWVFVRAWLWFNAKSNPNGLQLYLDNISEVMGWTYFVASSHGPTAQKYNSKNKKKKKGAIIVWHRLLSDIISNQCKILMALHTMTHFTKGWILRQCFNDPANIYVPFSDVWKRAFEQEKWVHCKILGYTINT